MKEGCINDLSIKKKCGFDLSLQKDSKATTDKGRWAFYPVSLLATRGTQDKHEVALMDHTHFSFALENGVRVDRGKG